MNFVRRLLDEELDGYRRAKQETDANRSLPSEDWKKREMINGETLITISQHQLAIDSKFNMDQEKIMETIERGIAFL